MQLWFQRQFGKRANRELERFFKNLAISTVADPVRKIWFMRGGILWYMQLDLDFGVSTYDDVQLSFRNNAATRGTVPVISFSDGFTGVKTLIVTLKMTGTFAMGLVSQATGGGNSNMFEMEWIVVP